MGGAAAMVTAFSRRLKAETGLAASSDAYLLVG